MGTIKKGILGGFSGKVGQVVGANWRGMDIMRSLPKKFGGEPTATQLEQRQRFGLVMSFLSPLKGILEKTYGRSSGSKSKINLAVSYHIREAITGIVPNLEIDFSKVVISRGELLGPKAAEISVDNDAEIKFNWEANSGTALSNDDDKPILVVYNPSKKLYVIEESNANRTALEVILQLPAVFSGDLVHCWMGFVSADGRESATSIYLGTVTVQ